MNEQSILSRVLPQLEQGDDIVIPPGDDCAAVDVGGDRLLLIAADQVIANTHYDTADTTPQEAARKLLKRNVSDIAAMGGTPAHGVLTIAAGFKDEQWFIDFFEGVADEARKWDISICGGDLSSTKSCDEVCSLTITGWVDRDKVALRANAKDGDSIFCTGELGNSYSSRHHLTFTPRVEAAQFLCGEFTNTMMDLSDGVGLDLERMCIASEIGARVDVDALPLRNGANIDAGLSDGEDYELLFSVPEAKVDALISSWPFKELKLTKLGVFTNLISGIQYVVHNKEVEVEYKPGFDHFR